MIHITHLKNDVRQIARDPVMLLLLFAPLLLILIFKELITILVPVLYEKTNFDLSLWYEYVLSFVSLIIPGLLGIVTGFMMIDERDGKIVELMSVTPMGRTGYIINRLSLSGILSVVWGTAAYYSLGIVYLPLLTLICLNLLMLMESSIMGLMLFIGAEDKVKGLTFAKGLNIMNLFAFSDLFSLRWLTVISWFFPSYWLAAVIKKPDSPVVSLTAIIVHAFWLTILILRFRKRTDHL